MNYRNSQLWDDFVELHGPDFCDSGMKGTFVEALMRVERETLERVEKAGCAHFCTPPCPFHRKMKTFAKGEVSDESR